MKTITFLLASILAASTAQAGLFGPKKTEEWKTAEKTAEEIKVRKDHANKELGSLRDSLVAAKENSSKERRAWTDLEAKLRNLGVSTSDLNFVVDHIANERGCEDYTVSPQEAKSGKVLISKSLFKAKDASASLNRWKSLCKDSEKGKVNSKEFCDIYKAKSSNPYDEKYRSGSTISNQCPALVESIEGKLASKKHYDQVAAETEKNISDLESTIKGLDREYQTAIRAVQREERKASGSR